jgi:hypothetical protein
MNNGELIIYQTEDGLSNIQLKAIDGTVWLTQREIANLFQTTTQNITIHIKAIYDEVELAMQATCKEYLQVRIEGQREVERQLKHYNLDVILAVGYRIQSLRGTQFRAWASTILKEYLVKGFAMDDGRLKQVEKWDYFDEWLARIRDIRASEKRFYQKIRDLYATAVDYDKASDHAQLFFKKVQNKMLWAVTGETAAELIANRSNPNTQNMGLTSWSGSIVRKNDIGIAKNYLKQDEIERLNRIVTMYLDYAEEQASKRKTITMEQWSEKLKAFLEFNEHDLLTHAGKVQMAVAQALAMQRYEEFDTKRRKDEAVIADTQDMVEIEQLLKRN